MPLAAARAATAVAVLALAGCGDGGTTTTRYEASADAKRYPLRGIVRAVKVGEASLTVAHDDIEGLMDAMTMDFHVQDPWVLKAAGPGDRLAWEGPLAPEHTLDRLRQATVYVLPSVDEPYPMSVLEAMSVGLPVVITDTCGLAGIVRESGAGLVVGPAQEELDEAVRRLLADRDGAEDMGRRGRAYVRENLGMEALARRLLGVYSGQATSGAGASS